MLLDQLLLFGAEFLLQRRELAVLQLRDLVEVVLALGFFDRKPGLFDLGFDFCEFLQSARFGFPLRLQARALFLDLGQLLLEFLQPIARRLIGLALERLALDFQLHHAPIDLVDLDRHRLLLGAQLGRRFIHQVDRLVGQESIGDVAFRQHRGRHQRRVLDSNSVMDLVAFLQPAQNRDGVLDARLLDHHRLKAPLQRRVLLDILAVLVERGRADAMQFAARQHGLEQVRRIHRAFSGARADDRMQLVDEQNYLARGFLHFLQHGLQPFLELAAELGARYQRSHVERDQLAILEALGHVARDDSPRETLDNRGLADPRLAYQHRVVLGAAREHLDYASNFLVASYHRIDFAGRRELGQVAAVFFQRLVGRLGIRRRDALVAADLLEHGHQLVVGQTCFAQNFRSGARLIEHRDQHVLDRNVLVLELARLLLGARQHPAQALGRVNLPAVRAAAGYLRNFGEFGAELAADRVAIDARQLHDRGRQPFVIFEQRRQQMLDVDGLVMRAERGVLRAPERLLEFFGESVGVHLIVGFPC